MEVKWGKKTASSGCSRLVEGRFLDLFSYSKAFLSQKSHEKGADILYNVFDNTIRYIV